jgi:hypothetical protein
LLPGKQLIVTGRQPAVSGAVWVPGGIFRRILLRCSFIFRSESGSEDKRGHK